MLKKDKNYEYTEIAPYIKQKQLYILDIVVQICEKYNLEYWLDAGTLLGAVRHKGFIPWDDDIDIGLMREDYEVLIKLLLTELPNDLLVQTVENDNKYYLMFAKVRDKYSHIYGEIEYDYNGVFIDIFPFDTITKSTKINKFQNYISNLMISLKYNIKMKGKMPFIKKILKNIISNKFIYKFIYKFLMSLSKIQNDKLKVSNGIVCPWAFYTSIREKSVYLPTQKVYFEGKLYSAPNNYKRYLTTLYGSDFMIPLKSKHNSHMEKIRLKREFFNNLEFSSENINC